tara:strand:+ start:8452 stop:8988 length:537 start_codon:yes stop_codon:yes gene_type:complete
MAYTNINQYNPLVNANSVVLISMVSQQFDTNLLTSSVIKLAEITHIEKPLSREFYEELVIQYNTASLTAANSTLYDDYLERVLCWFVKLEAMNEIHNNVTSSGVMTNIDDYSTKVSPAEFALMKNDVERKANLFLQDMLDFLNDSVVINNYPTYKKYGVGSSIINDDSTNKKGGVIFY